MKRLVVLAAIAASVAAFADVKIGTVDMMTLVKNHKDYDSNKQLLSSTEKDYHKRLDGMRAELESIQEEGKKLADEYRNPMLAQTAKTKLEGEIAAVQERFMAQQQKMRNQALRDQQELSDLEARLLKRQAEDLKKWIAKFAEAKGYDFILDSSAAIYAKKSSDVTDGVLKEMGVDPKAAKAKDAKDEGK